MHCQHALAPLAPETPISGRTDTEQPSPQLTPARRSRSGTPQNATSRPDVHHTNLVVRTRHDVALGRRAAYRVAHTGGAPESVVFSQPPLPEVIGEALTRAPVCRPEEHVVVSGPLPQERPIRKWLGVRLGLGRFDVHLRQRSGVDNVLGFSSRVWRTSSRAPLSM
ncbi:hypothetical protein EVAR_74600_1 [Eumeta japonica]|uniref:Uncharacterized protein n=1 Tax=Eumeta variegata TaxID=151549 RepID=A0A4C1WD95_EUMVA|nr:hypothetical protein EVAR_74600_1 [Eumeta japonica]